MHHLIMTMKVAIYGLSTIALLSGKEALLLLRFEFLHYYSQTQKVSMNMG